MRLDPDVWRPPVPIAHRGSRLLWPENTIEALAGAVELGYRHLEIDLHLTSDGVPVCIHDPTVDRTTDGTGPVSSYPMDRLQRLDAGYRHASPDGYQHRGQGVRVPTLEEVFEAFTGLAFVLDLKTDGLEGPVSGLLDRFGLHHQVIAGGFNDRRLEDFRRRTGGMVATSTGPALTRRWLIASRFGWGGGGEADAIQVPVQRRGVRVVDERLVDMAHRHGLQVHVWTVNQPDEMARLLDMAVDGVITDRPDLLKELLMERGQWHH